MSYLSTWHQWGLLYLQLLKNTIIVGMAYWEKQLQIKLKETPEPVKISEDFRFFHQEEKQDF